MKKLLLFIVTIILLTSCNWHKDAPPAQRHLSQQHTTRLRSLPVDLRYETSDSLSGGATNAIYDSVYKMSMTWPQAWHANSGSTKFWFVTLLCLCGASIYGMYITAKNRKDPNSTGFLVWLVPIFACLIIAASSVDWFHTYEKDIKKIDYETYMATDGNLAKWWPLPAQSY